MTKRIEGFNVISHMIKNIFIFALLCCLTGCSYLLYQPTQYVYYPPEKLGLSPKDVMIDVDKGVKIHGWYFSTYEKKHRALIIFFHGNAENLTSHYSALAWVLHEGYDFFIWDYRSYGQSTGTPTPQNTAGDGVKVIQLMHQEHPHLPIVIFAQSLGGAIAMESVIDLHHSIPIAALAVDSTFASYVDEARYMVSRSWITWIFQPIAYLVMSDKYAPDGKIDQISPTPFLVMHGNKDRIVKYELGQDIFNQAKEPKEFLKIEDGQHIDSFWKHDLIYRQKFLKYLERVLVSPR